ncbi:RodZ domain-containing protein [Guyparkeria sp.]|uniref:RodZ domain-containing protein n=1 Tax=Guyparkeria sp. TaxID=2035736 RepID=UPI0035656774
MSEQERRDPALGNDHGQVPGEEAISVGEQPAGPSVGERIRQGREAAGLTAADLAQPLNLDLRVIEDIERDALDEVPGRPYILAYLRSWAAQLGIDAESLIEQYNRQQGAAHGEIHGGQHPTLAVMESRNGGGGGWGRFLGWLLALIVAAIVVLALLQLDGERIKGWWQGLTGATAEQADQPADGGPVSGETAGVSEPEIAVTNGTDEDEPIGRPPASALSAEEPAAPATLGMLLPEGRLSALGSEAETESSSEAEPEAVPAGDEKPALVLRAVSGESWVEVRDAAGERLMYDVLAEGDSRTFDGDGPFSLVLGNPAALEVEYAGEPVELDAAGGSAGVTRLTVGDS